MQLTVTSKTLIIRVHTHTLIAVGEVLCSILDDSGLHASVLVQARGDNLYQVREIGTNHVRGV